MSFSYILRLSIYQSIPSTTIPETDLSPPPSLPPNPFTNTAELTVAYKIISTPQPLVSQVAPKAPSAATLTKLSANGACEAYPLDRADAHNSYTDVKLYIDEVGALRGRGRNKRAEALAASAGLAGLSIHGDAYVGRSRPGRGNLDFTMAELSPSSNWCVAAHRAHASAAAAAGHSDSEVLVGGSGAGYAWSQTDQEVEVRVAGAPEGKAGPKRVRVGYGSGNALEVTVDGKTLVSLRPLFDRVDTDGCVWTLEGSDVVVSMEKADPRPWTSLLLSGNAK